MGKAVKLKHEHWDERGNLQYWLKTRNENYPLCHAALSDGSSLNFKATKELAERDIAAQHHGIVSFENLRWLQWKISRGEDMPELLKQRRENKDERGLTGNQRSVAKKKAEGNTTHGV